MHEAFQVGSAEAEPGAKATGFLSIKGLGREAVIPVTVINGSSPGPILVITAGVHGGEYSGIDAAGRVARELDPKKIHGVVVVLAPVNPTAFHARSVYICPLDGKNLNRQFPGDHAGSATQKIAATVFEEVISSADAYVDMHGGDLVEDLVPFSAYFVTGDAALDAKGHAMARAYGIRYVNKGTTPGSTYASAARAGVPSILAESGGRGLRNEDMIQNHVDGLHNLLRHLSIVDEPEIEHEGLIELERMVGITSQEKGLFYPAVTPGETVRQGQNVGHITDYFGKTLRSLESPIGGPVIYVATSLATSPGNPLMAVGDRGPNAS